MGPVDGQRDYIEFEINMNDTYLPTQPVEGEVIVTNHYSAPLSEVFHVKIYKDEKLVQESTTNAKDLMPGKTTFTLQEFGLPVIHGAQVSDQGNWTISIHQRDRAHAQEAKFQVVSSI